MSCPCGSGLPLEACCGALHVGGSAATAEALMRSRYSAFALGDRAYLLRSWHSTTRPKELVLESAQEWTGLTVLSASGGLLDAEGTVAFRARWRHGSETGVLAETSRFVREDGRWVYLAALP